MLVGKTDEDRLVAEAKEDLNRLARAYNENKLTWQEYLHQVSFSVENALRSAREYHR